MFEEVVDKLGSINGFCGSAKTSEPAAAATSGRAESPDAYNEGVD